MSGLSLEHVYKVYADGYQAVTDFNLKVRDKEFVVLLGPEGSGKSTILRMIAGLEGITEGKLYIDDILLNDVELKNRDIAMVFPNFMLIPHKTVYDNMAFGLRLRKIAEPEIDSRVRDAAEMLGISGLLSNKLKALPLMQHLRTALGRAIVRNPKVILLDDPLAKLDADQRIQMRTEIIMLQNRFATTFIYASRDQEEATTIGSRIAVMNDGCIQQADTPKKLYDEPSNMFVAGYIGKPQMNFFRSVLNEGDRHLYVELGGQMIRLPENVSEKLSDVTIIGKEIIVGVRQESLRDNDNIYPDDCLCLFDIESGNRLL